MRMLPRPTPQGADIKSSSTDNPASNSAPEAAQFHSRCSVCRHTEAKAIAMEVLSGASLRSVAGRYGVSKSALVRHTEHLPENLIQARSASHVADSDLLLAAIVRHQTG